MVLLRKLAFGVLAVSAALAGHAAEQSQGRRISHRSGRGRERRRHFERRRLFVERHVRAIGCGDARCVLVSDEQRHLGDRLRVARRRRRSFPTVLILEGGRHAHACIGVGNFVSGSHSLPTPIHSDRASPIRVSSATRACRRTAAMTSNSRCTQAPAAAARSIRSMSTTSASAQVSSMRCSISPTRRTTAARSGSKSVCGRARRATATRRYCRGRH